MAIAARQSAKIAKECDSAQRVALTNHQTAVLLCLMHLPRTSRSHGRVWRLRRVSDIIAAHSVHAPQNANWLTRLPLHPGRTNG